MLAKTLVQVYKTKFDRPENEIMKMLEAETWILGSDAERYGLKCNVVESGEPMKIAAKFSTSI